MKVLFVSNLFPDASDPVRGQVNARLLQHLGALAEIRVLALRPSLQGWIARHAEHLPVEADTRFQPQYPLVPYLPKFGAWNHRLYAGRLDSWLRQIRRDFPFEVVLCSWLFPDASAICRLAETIGFRYVAAAQGSDVHKYLEMSHRRGRIVETVNRSVRTVARSAHLARLLESAGAAPSRVSVVYNGVATEVFHPGDRQSARQQVGLPSAGRVVLYVGNLLPVKNPALAIESFARFCQGSAGNGADRLVIVGKGPLESGGRALTDRLGITPQVVWAGSQNASGVARYLQAADVLCLPSDNEGLPNVMLEAMACGRPVVATRVGGIPEILDRPLLGRLVPPRDVAAMAGALHEVLESPSAESEIASIGRTRSWKDSAQQYLDFLIEAASPSS